MKICTLDGEYFTLKIAASEKQIEYIYLIINYLTMSKTFYFFLFMIVLIDISCVSKKKFQQVITEKKTADSTVMYLKTQLELAELRTQRQQQNHENSYRKIQDDLKTLRLDMQRSNAELRQLVEGKNSALVELQSTVKENYYTAKQFGLTANYDSTQVRTWLKETIFFASGQTQPTNNDLEKLDYLIATLDTYPNLALQIIGHTDAIPPRIGDNLDVSYRRAKEMRTYFIRKGIQPHRLSIVAQGEFKPLVKDKGIEDKNRRVEFVLLTTNLPPTEKD